MRFFVATYYSYSAMSACLRCQWWSSSLPILSVNGQVGRHNNIPFTSVCRCLNALNALNCDGGHGLLAVHINRQACGNGSSRFSWSKVLRPLGAMLYSSREPSELSQWLCHDDITRHVDTEKIVLFPKNLIKYYL